MFESIFSINITSETTKSIFITQGNYGIKSRLFSVLVGQNQPEATFRSPAIGTFLRRRTNLTFRRHAATVSASYFHSMNNYLQSEQKIPCVIKGNNISIWGNPEKDRYILLL